MDAGDQSQERRGDDGEPSFPSERSISGIAVRAPGGLREGPLFEGKYRLQEQLGRGGMGVVFAAEHIHSGAMVAIKMLSAKDKALGERLLRESRALARLGHPRIVQMFDCGVTSEGDYYIIMERVPGETLRTLMQRAVRKGRPLALRLILAVMAQMAEAMASAHEAGIVHRDVKPENIIVGKHGRAKLVDFGLAKDSATVAPAEALGAASNPANVTGTPRYMAPEQVSGGEIDGRTDVYAMGVVLYEAVCQRTPYGDDPTTAITIVMGHHLYAPPKPIGDSAPGCPEGVQALILRCLEKDPAQRYPSAYDLAKDLRAALERCVAQAQAIKAMGRVVRVTEPMPEAVEKRPVLPFVDPVIVVQAAVAQAAVAPVISEMVPPEDEEVTLKRGTMLPATDITALPVVEVAALPVVEVAALPVAVATTSAAKDAASTTSVSTDNGGITVETATRSAPELARPPGGAPPAARRKWFMSAPPYSVGALGGVVAAIALSSVLMGGAKRGGAREPTASETPALSASVAARPVKTAEPAPPPVETAVPVETAAPVKTAEPAPPPVETAAPAPLPAETVLPAPLPPPPAHTSIPAVAAQPPPVKPVPVRAATPAPSADFLSRKAPPATAPTVVAPPPVPAPPPPPAPNPHRIFGSDP